MSKNHFRTKLIFVLCFTLPSIIVCVLLWPYRWSIYHKIFHRGRQSAYVDMNWPYHDELKGKPYSKEYDGIDISRHQGRIHWSQLKANKKIKFIFIKATEGLNNVDPFYQINIDGARACGYKVGSYHFLTSKSDGRKQFAQFDHVIDRNKQDLLPIVDIEESGFNKCNRTKIQQTLRDFMNACKEKYNVYPIIYCNEVFFEDYLSPTFNRYYLFIANYSQKKPSLPGGTKYNIWQFSNDGHVRGIWTYVDLNKLEDRNLDKLLWR